MLDNPLGSGLAHFLKRITNSGIIDSPLYCLAKGIMAVLEYPYRQFLLNHDKQDIGLLDQRLDKKGCGNDDQQNDQKTY